MSVRMSLLCLALWGCAPELKLDPPEDPPHAYIYNEWVYGVGPVQAAHAAGASRPYLCTDPESGQSVSCPSQRPANANLSCDAAGCHGDTDYGSPLAQERHLEGSDGPSCWTCHGQTWSDRK
jgi:hypothetical protein